MVPSRIAAAVLSTVLAAAAYAQEPPPAGPAEILVLDATRGEPVADAEVVVSLEGDAVPEKERAPWSRVVRTGADGKAVVERGGAAAALRAQVGLLGARSAREPGGPTVLFLAPAGAVVVQALDAEGRPAPGVLLNWSRPGGMPVAAAATRGSLGLAVLPPSQGHPMKGRGSVRIDMNLPTLVEAGFDPGAESPPLVRLRLPPCPPLEIDVSGLDDGEAARVTYRASGRWLRDEERALLPSVPVVAGKARFPFVPPGVEVVVEVRCDAPGRPVARAVVSTPKQASVAAKAALHVGRDRAEFAGRVVTASGAPAADVIVWVDVPAGNSPNDVRMQLRQVSAITNEEGRFRIATDRDADVVAAGRAVVSVLRGSSKQPGESVRVATLVLAERRGEGGRIDLGDVPGTDALLVASGTVSDADGIPVPGATLWVKRRHGDAWSHVRGAVGTSVADGQFTVDSSSATGELRIVATAAGWYHEAPVAIARGDRGVRVILRQAATVEVATALPPGARPGECSIVVSREQEGPPPPGSDVRIGMATDRDGARVFRRDDLPPGRARISTQWHGVRVGEVLDADLRAGETWRPPGTIDVASSLRNRVVTVRRADGSPAGGARVAWRPSAIRSAWEERRADAEGRAALLVPDVPFDVFAVDSREGDAGTGVVFAPGLTADRVVLVRDRTPIDVVVRLDLRWTREAVAFSIGFSWVGPPGTRFDEATTARAAPAPGTEWANVAPGGETTVRVLEPGIYAVEVKVAAQGINGGFTQCLHDGTPTLVVVPSDATAPIRVTHRPDDNDVRDLLAQTEDL